MLVFKQLFPFFKECCSILKFIYCFNRSTVCKESFLVIKTKVYYINRLFKFIISCALYHHWHSINLYCWLNVGKSIKREKTRKHIQMKSALKMPPKINKIREIVGAASFHQLIVSSTHCFINCSSSTCYFISCPFHQLVNSIIIIHQLFD